MLIYEMDRYTLLYHSYKRSSTLRLPVLLLSVFLVVNRHNKGNIVFEHLESKHQQNHVPPGFADDKNFNNEKSSDGSAAADDDEMEGDPNVNRSNSPATGTSISAWPPSTTSFFFSGFNSGSDGEAASFEVSAADAATPPPPPPPPPFVFGADAARVAPPPSPPSSPMPQQEEEDLVLGERRGGMSPIDEEL